MLFDPFFSSMGFIPFIFVILGLFISILWSLLPFAVFGTKQRLDRIIEELERLNYRIEILEQREKEFYSKKIKENQDKQNLSETNKKDDDYSKYMPYTK